MGHTIYRIHGTNQPSTIGTFVSSGCIRLTNDDVMDLYRRVKVGTRVGSAAGPTARHGLVPGLSHAARQRIGPEGRARVNPICDAVLTTAPLRLFESERFCRSSKERSIRAQLRKFIISSV